MLFYAGFMALFIKHATKKKTYGFLLFIPVLAMLFDWIENIGIIALLKSYTNLPKWAVLTASISGMFKFIFTVGSIGITGMLFILAVCLKFRKNKDL